MGIENKRVSYEIAKRAVKDLVLREMNRYLLPYWYQVINENEFRNAWDTYTRPYIFDVMTSSLYDLGFVEDGPTSCRSIDNEHSCFWYADFYDINEIMHNGFLVESSLTIPYTGPFEDLTFYTASEQDFTVTPWVKEDDVGDWVPPWIGPDGTYHPGYWTGFYATDSATRSITGAIKNDCQLSGSTCKASRVYLPGTAGTFGDFLYHEFRFTPHNINTVNCPPCLLYALANGLFNANIIRSSPHIGLWSVPVGYEQIRLHCATDYYYPHGPLSYMGYGRQIRLEDPLETGGWMEIQDMLWIVEEPYSYRGSDLDFKVTVERRGNDVIFIFWLKRGSFVSGSTNEDFTWVSTPWMLKVNNVSNFYDQWPGAGDARSTGRFSVFAFPYPYKHVQGFNTPSFRSGVEFWYPIDIVHIRVDPTYNFDYLYVGNYWGSNDFVDFNGTEVQQSYILKELNFHDTYVSDTISMFVDGGAYDNDNVTLFTSSFGEEVDNVTLFLSVAYPMNLTTTLYINGVPYPSSVNYMTLYMYEREYVNDNIPLFMSQTEVQGDLSLYMFGVPNPQNVAETLFIYDLNALEDLTTYTLVDESAQVTGSWTYTRVDASDWVEDGDVRFYKDFGDNFFGPTWQIDFEMEWNGGDDVDFIPLYVGNVVNDLLPFGVCTDEVVAFYYDSSLQTWNLESFSEGYTTTVTSPTKGVHYWGRFARRGTSSGTYEYYISLWTNNTRTGEPEIYATRPAGTLNYYRYLVLAQIENTAGSDTISFVIENVLLSDVPAVDATTLFLKAKGISVDTKTLYIEGWAESANTYTTLHTFGGTDGYTYATDNIPLYINDGGYIGLSGEHSIDLFLYNDDPFVPLSHTATLYIYGRYEVVEAHMTLVSFSLSSNSSMTLFVKNETGGIAGYKPDQDQLPLYLHRSGESDSISLVVFNNWTTANSYVPLNIKGVLGVPNANITLAMPDVIDGRPNTYINLFIEGHLTDNDSMTLAMPSTHGTPFDNISLVCFHGGGEPNSYMTCFINGVLGVPSDNITLAMSEVIGKQNDSVTLYSKGY